MELSGIDFYHGTYKKALAEIQERAKNGERTLVVTPNPEMLYDACADAKLLAVLQKADYRFPDGIGIFIAYQIAQSRLPKLLKALPLPLWGGKAMKHSKLFARKYGERITGAQLTKDLLKFAAKQKMQVIIFDTPVIGLSSRDLQKKEFQSNTKKILEKKFPGIRCHLLCCNTIEELPSLTESKLRNSIIFAVQGNGKQEKFLAEFQKKYPDSGLALAVGGSIDCITGFREEAPEGWKKSGFEWFFRLLKNPKKHAKRIKKVLHFLQYCINNPRKEEKD